MSLDDDPQLFDLGSALLTEKTPEDDSGTPVKNSNERPNLRDTMSRGEAELNQSADDDSPESSDDDEQVEVEVEVDAGEETDQQQEEEQAEQDDIVFARAAAMGLDLKGKYGGNKEAAIDGLLHAARLVGQKNQLAEYGRQLLENPQAVLASLEKLYKKQEAEAKQPEKKSDVPEFDPAWREMVDEEGKPLPGVDPAIPLKMKKYYEFIRNRAEQIARDPESVIMPTLEEKIKKMVDERASAIAKQESDRLRAEQATVNTAREAQQLVQEEASWAFVDGDISKGPTPEGQVLGKWLQILETPDEAGNIPIPNMRMRKEVAVMMARQELGAIKAKDNSPERRNRQEKITKKTNRSAGAPTSKSWPKGLTLEEALLRSYDKQ
jgi:hypothetical protein